MLSLGVAVSMLHLQTNKLNDLDEAISIFESIQNDFSKDSSEYLRTLSELSSALRRRYEVTGRLSDLQRSLDAQQLLVDTLSGESSILGLHLSTLAILITEKSSFTGNYKQLYLAEKFMLKAIELNNQDEDFIARCYFNLANIQKSIFHNEGSEKKLFKVIHSRQLSIEKTPESSHELAARLVCLSQDEFDLYELIRDPSLLENTLERMKLALTMSFTDDMEQAGVRYFYAQALAKKYALSHSENDLQEAKRMIAKAQELARESSAPLYYVISKAWAYWALERRSWDEASNAFRNALEGADKLVSVQSTLLNSANRIAGIEDLHINASYAFYKSNNIIEAVLALEHGRARLFNQIRSYQSIEFPELEKEHPELAEEAKRVASRLAFLNQKESESLTISPLSIMSIELKTALENWESIILKIRGVPSFESFGRLDRKSDIDDITDLTLNKPVVYISHNYYSGFALIVNSSGDIVSVDLPNLSTENLYSLFNQTSIMTIKDGSPKGAIDEICKWLWLNAMGPLVSQLEDLGVSDVFFIPSGLLGILPLHAAWTFDKSKKSGRVYVIDKLAVSYIPSAKIALENLPATNLPLKSAFFIEDPTSELHYAAVETKEIIRHFSNATLLGGEAATKNEVLKRVTDNNVLHFSCHGSSQPADPMRSGLIMAFKERLTVADLQSLHFSKTRLITLSACETGLIGNQMMDEVLGFPAALMALGVPCILSAIWSVDDESTCYLMRLFYKNLINTQMSAVQSLREAQIQLRDSPEFDSRFAHPFYWGAFFVTGY